ncbi:unnamed protein product [Schistosoma rodhaini]|uniref:Translocon-associated protein subunit gamma n=1 Tax=Schistosoma rodhaini TaxID=6188 RepID=A0AA85GGQ5_9TREM|nr:unnamed protein product [Schistosoma rodhaini]
MTSLNVGFCFIIIFIILNKLNAETRLLENVTKPNENKSTTSPVTSPTSTSDRITSTQTKMRTTDSPTILIFWNDSESSSRPKKWITMWSVVITTVFYFVISKS